MDKLASLTPEAYNIIVKQGTEAAFSGEYNNEHNNGTYLCRRCGIALFRADNKFASSCGWPSFDASLANNVLKRPDSDGLRTEIICRECSAHLGHIFTGEHLTEKNTRYCVNSLAIDFIDDTTTLNTEEAIIGGGCFWGVQALMQDIPGVLKTEVGYSGGSTEHPTYEQVCHNNNGHIEVLRVVFDPRIISYQTILQHFFEIHNPTQIDGQGPDLGSQYRSAVFYYNETQQTIANQLIQQLTEQGLTIATTLFPAQVFWRAEQYHQHYYKKNKTQPYCHFRTQRF